MASSFPGGPAPGHWTGLPELWRWTRPSCWIVARDIGRWSTQPEEGAGVNGGDRCLTVLYRQPLLSACGQSPSISPTRASMPQPERGSETRCISKTVNSRAFKNLYWKRTVAVGTPCGMFSTKYPMGRSRSIHLSGALPMKAAVFRDAIRGRWW